MIVEEAGRGLKGFTARIDSGEAELVSKMFEQGVEEGGDIGHHAVKEHEQG